MSRRETSAQPSPQNPRRRHRRWRAFKIGLAALAIMVIGLVAVPIISPETSASIADGLRSIFGPEPVANLESLSFQAQDALNRARYQLNGGQPQISWDDPLTATMAPTATVQPPITVTPTVTRPLPSATFMPPTIAPTPNVINAPSLLDSAWQAFGPTSATDPIMARAQVKPDPTRPYAQAALVRIDLSQVQLYLVPGTIEPVAAKGVKSVPRPGIIPVEVQANSNLLAAFNGGFKAVHGGYGMLTEVGLIRPPLADIATVAMYRDGSVRIGAWGRDITTTLDLVAYRQNCPLLVDAGAINPHVNDESRKEWGYTVKNLDTTWRSGLGISRDGRFLIYAVGDSLTVESLAHALQQAGAYSAMQLDINGLYTRFVTYSPSGATDQTHALVANKLLAQMSGNPSLFLQPYTRDFFYITAR